MFCALNSMKAALAALTAKSFSACANFSLARAELLRNPTIYIPIRACARVLHTCARAFSREARMRYGISCCRIAESDTTHYQWFTKPINIINN